MVLWYIRDIGDVLEHYHVVTEQQLIDMCKKSYWDKRSDAVVWISDGVHGLCNKISPIAFTSIFTMALLVQRRNVLLIEQDKLVYILNYNKSDRFNYRSVKKILNELKKRHVLDWQLMGGKVVRVIFHYNLVWKGDKKVRDMLIRDYLSPNF